MDPLVSLLPELHDMVFHHFEVFDIKKITEVSPTWNKTLGGSRMIMKKLRIKLLQSILYKDRESRVIRNLAQCTVRRYQNAYISCKMLRCQFSRKLFMYVTNGGKSLVNLEIDFHNWMSEEDTQFYDALDLSNLKTLKLEFVTESLTSRLLARFTSLTKLFLRYNRTWEVNIPSLRTFLQQNQCLKTLELTHIEYYNVFFTEDISEFVSFRLKNLKIIHWILSPSGLPDTERNFIKFLATQSQSLESLSVNEARPKVIEFFFNNMPALKHLEIFGEFEVENLRLNLNENIVELGMPSLERPEDIEHIICAVPNLKKLRVQTLSQRNIEIIERLLPHLQQLN